MTRRFAAGLVPVLAMALFLRLLHLGEGLPDFVDESFPFRHAFEMAGWERGRIDWNPHVFHYPSLAYYVHLGLQMAFYLAGRLGGVFGSPADLFLAFQTDPGPLVMVGRLFGVGCDLAVLAGVAVIGERLERGAGMLAAALLALSPALILGTRSIGVDPLMVALGVWSLERLLAWHAGGSPRASLAAIVLAGLATGTKYPAALLLVPIGWAFLDREGRRGLGRLAWAALGIAILLVATSPFLLFEVGRVMEDARKISNLLGAGQLGSATGGGPTRWLHGLASGVGWPALVLAAAGIPFVLRRDPAARGWAIVWVYVLAFAVPAATSRASFDRYLLPVLPGVALLASMAMLRLAALVPAGTDRIARIAGMVLLLIAPAADGLARAVAGGDTTPSLARRWLETNLPDSVLVVQESYGAPLRSCPETARIVRSRAFAAADERWKTRFLARRTMHAVTLPLLVGGRGAVAVPGSGGETRFVDVWPSSSDLNQVFYEPSLYAAVDIVVTSAAVRGRYEADPARHPRQLAFYRWLERETELVARFDSDRRVTGPAIRIYRRRAPAGSAAAQDPLWWATSVPDAPRRTLDAFIAPGVPLETGLRDAQGRPAPWVSALGAVFDRQIAPFCYAMAAHQAELGRFDFAREFAGAVVAAGDPAAENTRRARSLLAGLPPTAPARSPEP